MFITIQIKKYFACVKDDSRQNLLNMTIDPLKLFPPNWDVGKCHLTGS